MNVAFASRGFESRARRQDFQRKIMPHRRDGLFASAQTQIYPRRARAIRCWRVSRGQRMPRKTGRPTRRPMRSRIRCNRLIFCSSHSQNSRMVAIFWLIWARSDSTDVSRRLGSGGGMPGCRPTSRRANAGGEIACRTFVGCAVGIFRGWPCCLPGRIQRTAAYRVHRSRARESTAGGCGSTPPLAVLESRLSPEQTANPTCR